MYTLLAQTTGQFKFFEQLLASLTMNEYLSLCSRYKLCSANVTTNCVKFSVWSSFEQSVICMFLTL